MNIQQTECFSPWLTKRTQDRAAFVPLTPACRGGGSYPIGKSFRVAGPRQIFAKPGNTSSEEPHAGHRDAMTSLQTKGRTGVRQYLLRSMPNSGEKWVIRGVRSMTRGSIHRSVARPPLPFHQCIIMLHGGKPPNFLRGGGPPPGPNMLGSSVAESRDPCGALCLGIDRWGRMRTPCVRHSVAAQPGPGDAANSIDLCRGRTPRRRPLLMGVRFCWGNPRNSWGWKISLWNRRYTYSLFISGKFKDSATAMGSCPTLQFPRFLNNIQDCCFTIYICWISNIWT